MLQQIIAELARPDSQKRDWYGWASNQLAHAFIGVALTVLVGFWAMLLAAVAKETADVWTAQTSDTLWDSAQDLTFWVLGGLVIVSGDDAWVLVLAISTALVVGIAPRLRRVMRGKKYGNDHQ